MPRIFLTFKEKFLCRLALAQTLRRRHRSRLSSNLVYSTYYSCILFFLFLLSSK